MNSARLTRPYALYNKYPARSFSCTFATHRKTPSTQSASAKLFADAVDEERPQPRATPVPTTKTPEKNWDGDESMEDAVLRMLVDKYKPLRTGVVRSADEKLKAEAQKVNSPSAFGGAISLDDLPPLPLPSSFTGGSAKVKVKVKIPVDPDDAKARAETRRARKLTEGPHRLGSAREKSFEYRIGKTSGGEQDARPNVEPIKRANPVSLGGWTAMVEDAIEKARTAGVFDKVEGRGKPLKRYADEGNPFIPREEFLMNRIIKRGAAAPPWVEVQGELEGHIRTFRRVLQQSWTRRAIRNLLLKLPPPPYPRQLPNLTVDSVKLLRDPEWEARERSYHDAALEEVNSQIRRHNGLAPYPARRGYLMLKFELERCYEDSAEEIVRTVEERLASDEPIGRLASMTSSFEPDKQGAIATAGLWEMLKKIVMRLMPAPAPLRGDHPVTKPDDRPSTT